MDNKKKQYCAALMLFDTAINLGTSNEPEVWVNYKTLLFDNGKDALNAYVNIPCPASQLITAEDDYELKCKIGEMILNYQDKDWLNKYLYPYL